MLRRILASSLLVVALPLAAQQPPKLEPLPEPPPPPPGASADQPGEPSVRIEPGASEQIPSGQEYYLIEDLGDGPGLRNESLDRGVRVPLWVIRRF